MGRSRFTVRTGSAQSLSQGNGALGFQEEPGLSVSGGELCPHPVASTSGSSKPEAACDPSLCPV